MTVQYAVAAAALPARAVLRSWAAAAQERDMSVTMRFVGSRESRRLNANFRGRDYPTNVLTFVYDEVVPLAGDIVLCAPVLRREAREAGTPLRHHCAHLVVHGMLHLQGHDHDTAHAARLMEAHEIALLAQFGIANPYS